MRAWKRLFAAAAACILSVFILANLALYHRTVPEKGRPYRVEINRLALLIQESGPEGIDLSRCEYVKRVTEDDGREDFYLSDSDYVIRKIGGRLYRFDYAVKSGRPVTRAFLVLNGALAVMTAAVIAVLFYVRRKILKPFESLAGVPFELSRGNLALPVREEKSRFFGKFLWGMDLLRESIEQQRQRELELQKDKKTLLLSLSHDIKTPLSTIKLYSQALSKNLYTDEEKRKKIADSVNEKADEIEGYVARIVTASKEDFLSFDVENGEFYLSALIGNIESYYREKLGLVKTEFILGKYKDRLLSGDPDRSVEVLQNVMENALKYGDGRSIELLFPEDDEGVLIAVKNSGCTLDRDEMPHIFDSFYRGSNSGNARGSGLGLYICRQLMHRMGGEIFAEIEGEWITVTVVFSKV